MKKIAMSILFALLLAVSSCACAASIKLGSTGSEVTRLQKNLTTLGFYSGSISGHAGEKTVAAIKAFQKKYGLTQDGIAGSATLGKIDAVLNPGAAQEPAAKTDTDDVKQAQTILKALGLYNGQITGNIGTKTKAALKIFQKQQGIAVDGTVSAETLKRLKAASVGEKQEEKPQEAPAQSSSAALRYGSTGTAVSDLQKKLKVTALQPLLPPLS